ncbi:MAG TPA: cytochrome c [Pyrinomonadaceae bacterium]|nr:cytochrome c [Pyrinomonadaceae bacterium]
MNNTLGRLALAGAILIGVGFLLVAGNTALATSAASSGIFNAGDARPLYDKKCAECHGKDGQSHTFRGKHTHSRDLSDSQWQDQVTDERIYNSIANGKGKMPAFSKKLSDADMNSLVTFVRTLKR